MTPTRSDGSEGTSSWCSSRGRPRSAARPSSPSGSSTCSPNPCGSATGASPASASIGVADGLGHHRRSSCSTTPTSPCTGPRATGKGERRGVRAGDGERRCRTASASSGTSHRALERDELFLLYQPTFDLRTGATTGVEALLRWHHPSRGVVSPVEFIPVAEESGLIVPIGRWVLDRACRQGARWEAAGYPIRLSVNVSARQLDRDELVDEVRQALDDSGFDPRTPRARDHRDHPDARRRADPRPAPRT